MKIQLIDPRNKRLKNKIATYNSENHTWTIGKSKKVYQVVFTYYFASPGEWEKNPKLLKYFDSIGCVIGDGRFPIKELDEAKTNGVRLNQMARFYDKSLKGHSNGVIVDGFEVLEY